MPCMTTQKAHDRNLAFNNSLLNLFLLLKTNIESNKLVGRGNSVLRPEQK